MTQSIPNGFSSEELQRMLSEAQPEPTHEDDCDCCDTEGADVKHMSISIAEDVQETMDNLAQNAGVPPQLVGKLVMLMTLNRMIEWHAHVGQMHAERGEHEGGASWVKDAGKFQACVNILATIMVSDDDFTIVDKDD